MGRNEIRTCDRCDGLIVNQSHIRPEPHTVSRHDDDGGWESKKTNLCSMCYVELWNWLEPEDSPDRSDTTDPMSLERIEENVELHIDKLEREIERLTDRIERE